MEESECVDLESLLDLIDEKESTNDSTTDGQVNNLKKPNESNGFDSDTLNKIDSSCDISSTHSIENQKRNIKLNDFLFSDAAKQGLNASSISETKEASLIHTGDTSSDDDEEKEHLNETGEHIKQKIKPRSYNRDGKETKDKTWKNEATSDRQSCSKVKPQSLDKLTGVRIVNPLVAFDVMEKRLMGKKLIKMSLLKNFLNKGSDVGIDWVTVGVLVRKFPPKTSKAGKVFSIWKLTDLHDTDKLVTLFLFGNVHTEHWKMAVGTVIGLLNPIVMEATEQDVSIKVDHPGKILSIGTAKDLGHCKSKKKDGTQCNNVVNTSQCQYCTYHIKSEYKKLGQGNNSHSLWSGKGSTTRDKLLKGQNFFYGGQSFVPLGKPQKKSNNPNNLTSKDKLTLSNLTLLKKASIVFNEEKSKSAEKVTELYGEAVSKNSEFINQRLLQPSAGSRNFLLHMVKNKIPEEKNTTMIHPRELLKQHTRQMKSHLKKDDNAILETLRPVLGKGLSPGQSLTFNIQSPTHEKLAKVRAIQKIRETGPLKRKNPNAVKSNPEAKKIKAALENSFEENSADNKPEEKTMLRSKLGCIDLNSEKVQRYLKQNSNHAYEVQMAEMEREAAYFDKLEKRESMEEKMSATKEIVCSVVSCKQCRYTAHQAAERCKNERHPLKCHKAIKRFYECRDCKLRIECFSRFPLVSCSKCGGSRYERTGMIKVRSGPKLDSEVLNIRSDGAEYINNLYR